MKKVLFICYGNIYKGCKELSEKIKLVWIEELSGMHFKEKSKNMQKV